MCHFGLLGANFAVRLRKFRTEVVTNSRFWSVLTAFDLCQIAVDPKSVLHRFSTETRPIGLQDPLILDIPENGKIKCCCERAPDCAHQSPPTTNCSLRRHSTPLSQPSTASAASSRRCQRIPRWPLPSQHSHHRPSRQTQPVHPSLRFYPNHPSTSTRHLDSFPSTSFRPIHSCPPQTTRTHTNKSSKQTMI